MVVEGVKTMVQIERKCGFRSIGGNYLYGNGLHTVCHRLPLRIENCPICGRQKIEFFRGIKLINPALSFDECGKGEYATAEMCICPPQCPVCNPPQKGWFMWVGAEYTMASFVDEARRWGVSKKVYRFPNELKKGDIVYLGYRTAILYKEKKVDKYHPALFYAFKITDKQQIISAEDAENEKKVQKLKEKGITPVLERNLFE